MRCWNKEKIEEQLKLHKKQNKDERYNYFSREFNSLYYTWELEKYTIKKIDRLNKELDYISEELNKCQDKLLDKENIINELEKWLYECRNVSLAQDHMIAVSYIDIVLNKLKELKGEDK